NRLRGGGCPPRGARAAAAVPPPTRGRCRQRQARAAREKTLAQAERTPRAARAGVSPWDRVPTQPASPLQVVRRHVSCHPCSHQPPAPARARDCGLRPRPSAVPRPFTRRGVRRTPSVMQEEPTMSEGRAQILEMLVTGRLTVEQADRLLEALDAPSPV